MPKCSTTNKLQKEFCGNSFPNCTIICMTTYASSKVTHAKYAVAEKKKQITVIPVLRNLWPLLNCIFALSFRILNSWWTMSDVRNGWRPVKAIPYDVYLLVTTSASWLPSLTRKLCFICAVINCTVDTRIWLQLYYWLLLALYHCKIAFQLHRWIKCVIY